MKNYYSKIIWGGGTVIAGLFFALIANAQSYPIANGGDLSRVLCNLIAWMIYFLFAVAIIMVVLAAFQYVTAGDDTEKTTKARKTLTYAAIGIVVALMAYGFPPLVASIVGTSAGFSCGAGPSSSVSPTGSSGTSNGTVTL
jgi:heme/copper-type cytochrome/quinol oxidase subunit 2